MGKVLYLECNSGISGDMTVGALLDLGADKEVLVRALDSLGVSGYHLHFGRKETCGLDAYDFDVHLEAEEGDGHFHDHEDEHFHGHEHSHEHGHSHGHEHSHEDGHSHEHGHSHDHEHSHEHEHSHDHEHSHSHEHAHEHGHAHVHRNLQDIYEIIARLDASERVREMARKMFRIVAEAESKAHGLPIDQVHFHEVGAVDSIVDIISVAVCIDNLGVSEVVVSSLAEGHGSIRCQHGVLPVPVPATANIAAAYGLKLRLTDNEGEMVTPTGAAIAAALRTSEKLPESCRVLKIGMGAGNRQFKQANVLRAMLLETEEPDKEETLWVLETNVDDCGGEMLGFVMEELLETGALDVWFTPIFMKKNRPAYMLSVLCSENMRTGLERLLFRHTTTIGIRRHPVERTILSREKKVAATCYGEAEVKVCRFEGETYIYPEYECVKALCREQGLDFKTVFQEVRRAADKQERAGWGA